MPVEIPFEICIDSVQGAVAAQENGAQRVELCDNLIEGGTTPSAAKVQLAREKISIGLNVIVRPRGGDFCYSDLEFDTMKRDLALAKEWGADGLVIGILQPDGSVDKDRCHALMEIARPHSVTFHRAFDMTADPFAALEDLVDIGVDRLLTSGQEETALEGADLIRNLVEKAAGRIIIMACGGIRPRNLRKVLDLTNAPEIHFAALAPVESRMAHRNANCYMGAEFRPPEFSWKDTNGAFIADMRKALG